MLPAAVLLWLAGMIVMPSVAAADQQPDREFQECTDCPVMVAIPAGSFVMGSPATERGRFDSEGPQHAVALRAFAMSKLLVTSAEFLGFLRQTGYQPIPCNAVLSFVWHSPGGGRAYPPIPTGPPTWPADCLSWDDAEAYLAWLNRKVAGLASARASAPGPYRLPSEAEWEYAARAGTTTARWWGEAIGIGRANCNGCGSAWDGSLLAPVGSFGPNPFGLFDMLGNVWQFTADCWNETYVGAPIDGSAWTSGDCSRRVLRGGSWSNLPAFIRAASRARIDADGADSDYSNYAGIRIARNLP